MLKDKLEVKMTKAFGKLQGFVFTILSSNITFRLAAYESFGLFFSSGKKEKAKKTTRIHHSRLGGQSEKREAVIIAEDEERE